MYINPPHQTVYPAFTTAIPLHQTNQTHHTHPTTPIRRRPRPTPNRAKATLQTFPSEPNDEKEDIDPYKSLFTEEEQSFWDQLNVRTALRPITEEEKATLRTRLPLRVANFLIRRAEDAERMIEPSDESFFGKLLKDLPPDTPDEDDDEYRDYVFESVAGPPGFRRRGVFSGDGLADVDDLGLDDASDGNDNVMSLFIGRVGSVDEQASKVGYGLFALFAGWLLFKIFFALISFFVSFTFSFFAIFALSAGIFMVFFFFKW